MTRRSGWKGEEKGKRKSDNIISVGLRITIHSKKFCQVPALHLKDTNINQQQLLSLRSSQSVVKVRHKL